MTTNQLPPMEYYPDGMSVHHYSIDVLVSYLDDDGNPTASVGYYDYDSLTWGVAAKDGEVYALEPDEVIGWWPMPSTDDPTFTRLNNEETRP